jgi:3-methyladenine DNA glycosylase Mpg
LGISKDKSGLNLTGSKLFLVEDDQSHRFEAEGLVGSSSRIGIEGAGPSAVLLPYRFYVKGNKFVSGSPNK